MDDYESLSHTKWECKYQIVFIPECRRKTIFGQIRQHPGEVFRKLAAQKESRIEDGHLQPDHVHMLISIPPKYAVSQVRLYQGEERYPHCPRVWREETEFCWPELLGSRVFVSTVGRDEAVIREYIKSHEGEDKRLEQLSLWR